MSDLQRGRHTAAPNGAGGARAMVVAAFVSAVLALVIPIVFGPAAIALGVVAHRRGDPLGKRAAIAGAVGLVVGTVVGMIILLNRN